MVIFGASGDLTARKLVPALYNLQVEGSLPEPFAVVGASRKDLTREAFLAQLREGLEAHSRRALDEEAWERLADRISYVQCESEADYDKLAAHLDTLDADRGTAGNRLFYLATPPGPFPTIVSRLGDAGLNRPGKNGRWARVVVEKPIGTDSETARELNDTINRVFDEHAVFRIDHYLGKETVQNLLVFRFANAIFEPLWNQKYVDHVQLTVAESIGVEGRGRYYEEAGTTRDMVQNHLFQLLCLTAMEPPSSLAADAIRNEKVKVLEALRPVDPDRIDRCTVRAQYGPGVVDGKKANGYREEEGVAADSRTETYVAARLFIDNWRWAGVPFYLRSGKRLSQRLTEIVLQFHDVPHRLFKGGLAPNVLTLRIQPDEGINLQFDAKVPGRESKIRAQSLDYAFTQDPPEAYERLILDAISGDSTLFIRRDEVEASWAYIDRLHEGWRRQDGDQPLPDYAGGTWGPPEADVMLDRDGRKWQRR